MNPPSLNHPRPQQVVIPIVQSRPQPQPPPPPSPPTPANLPRDDLLVGSRENYIFTGVPLYDASIKGDWLTAKSILDRHPELTGSGITENYETPLHVAASAKNTKSVEKFVENLVGRMEKKELELQNKNHNTALSLAAAAGNVKMAKIMVNKNAVLPEIPGSNGMMPLYVATLFAKHEMVKYLYGCSQKMSGDFWTDVNRSWVLQKCIEADIFDVALKIVADRTELTTKVNLLGNVLIGLAKKTKSFFVKEKDNEALELLKIIWKKIAIMPKDDIDEILRGPSTPTQKHPSRILFVAAKEGNARFIIELIRLYPDLIWKVNDNGISIFHVAVKRRHETIYNLLYEIGSMKDLITPLKDEKGNNMLHLVGKSAKAKRYKTVSGVALQMQRELLWFNEVERMIPPAYRERKNNAKETPHDLFTKKHVELLKESADWMKDTASQCMVVATLIATIVFAAAFTLPGGYDQGSGIPIFQQELSFIIFVISDAISLISSSTSVLVFLSILTSRYAERDFVKSLPQKLMYGLAALFLSIITMMVAFSASFFVLYHKNLKWLPIVVTSLAAIPVVLFLILQFRLLSDVFSSTYSSRDLFNPKKRMLY